MGVELAIAGFVSLAAGAAKAVNTVQVAKANARAAELQNYFQIEMNKINQDVLELDKESAKKAGEVEAEAVREQAKQILGTQQVAQAAQGVDVSFGSAADIQQDTRYLAEIDSLTVKNNAMKAAFGIQTEQIQRNLQTSMNSLALENQRRTTLSTGGIAAATEVLGGVSSFMNYRQMYNSGSTNNTPKVAI